MERNATRRSRGPQHLILRIAMAATVAGTASCGGTRATTAGDPPAPAEPTAAERTARDAGVRVRQAPARLTRAEAQALTTLGAVEGEPIRQLPAVATYAFVAPSRLFTVLDSLDDLRSAAAEFSDHRESAAAVLRANGWREATADSAAFLLAFAVHERIQLRQESRPDPRNERSTVPTCDPNWRATGRRCVEPAPPRHPLIVTTHQEVWRRTGFSILRVRDGATRWWLLSAMNADEQRRYIAEQVLRLLLVEDP